MASQKSAGNKRTVEIDGKPAISIQLGGKRGRGKRLILDPEDYESLTRRFANGWSLARMSGADTVVGNLREKGVVNAGKAPQVRLKRLIVGADDGDAVHTINGDPCDLRRVNLEVRPNALKTPHHTARRDTPPAQPQPRPARPQHPAGTTSPAPYFIRSAGALQATATALMTGGMVLAEPMTVDLIDTIRWPTGNDGNTLQRSEVLTILAEVDASLPLDWTPVMEVTPDYMDNEKGQRVRLTVVVMNLKPPVGSGLPSYTIYRAGGRFIASAFGHNGTDTPFGNNVGGGDGQWDDLAELFSDLRQDILDRLQAAGLRPIEMRPEWDAEAAPAEADANGADDALQAAE